ncbi:M4 family metallopeptidase [Flavobacteriaceae bacterium LMO-SS05]
MKFNNPTSIINGQEQFIKQYGLDSNNTFVEYQSNLDKSGILHQKFQQYYKNIKVEYGTMIIHSKNGNVITINGELYNPNELNLESNLSTMTALEHAKSHVGAQHYLWDDAEATNNIEYKKPVGELVIFPIIKNKDYTLQLAYKFDIYATVPVSRGFIYINAKNGDFLFNDPIIKHYSASENRVSEAFDKTISSNSNRTFSSSLFSSGSADTRYSGNRTIETRSEIDGTFTLNDDTRRVHTYNAQNSVDSQIYLNTRFDFIDNDNNWTAAEYNNAAKDNAALDAHWAAMNVYDFWASLGRNSFNDAGAEIRNYVHVGTNYFNAFWNGYVMSYGDGSSDPLTYIDVVSHEIAHGVTSWTADLVYARESGAMNEAFSDIFAAAIEHFAVGAGTDLNPGAGVWLISAYPGFNLRSMSNPNSLGDPDTYNGLYYTDATTNCIPSSGNDGCGVHSNSGVLNHWFYILVKGKSGTNSFGNSFNVTGIGMSKAQNIAYFMLRDYLTPNSTFMDARNAAIEVASSLYGSNSAERTAVQDAFFAVNLGDEFIPIPTDIKLVEFSELVDITCGESVTPKIKVRNEGAINAINTIQVNYSIDGAAQTPFNWNGTLALDEETVITLPTINESAVKSYNLFVEAIVVGDGDATNNSITQAFRVNKADNNPTEVNDFEQILVDYWLTYNQGGGANLWSIKSPNKANLNSVTSGTFAQVTGGSTSNYSNETKAYLISPCYDLTTITSPKMKFNMAFRLQENYDILYVESSTDLMNWTLLGSATDPNWYNSNRIFESGEISSDCQNCPGAQWTGISNEFTEYNYDLSAFKTESKINFRFVFHSDSSITEEGVVIDDFVIYDNSLGINDLESLTNQVLIYPNPSSNIFTLSFEKTYNNIDLDVYDIMGGKVLSQKNISKPNNKYELDMSNFSKGLYFTRIKIEKDFTIVKKLILE